MNKYILLLCGIVFLACMPQHTEKDSATSIHNATEDTVAATYATDYILFDSLKLSKLKEYAPRWNSMCFPMPEPVVLMRKPADDPGYLYLINSFDSLSAKMSTEKERSAGFPCSWEQSFQTGIVYSRSTCTESGTVYQIHTNCRDKKALACLIDIIFQADVNNWNSDSTQYAPILEEAGAYYSIEKNSAGNYDINYSSSY